VKVSFSPAIKHFGALRQKEQTKKQKNLTKIIHLAPDCCMIMLSGETFGLGELRDYDFVPYVLWRSN